MNYGDFPIEETIHVFFTTRAFATGIPGTLSAATVAVYEDITSTPIETSIAVTETLNSIAGLNAVPIVAIAASGYEVGKNYHVVIEAGTVDSVSVVGEVVAYFSIGRSAAAVDLAQSTDGLGAIKTDTAAVKVATDKLTFTVANQLDTNPLSWSGGLIPAQGVTGVPEVDVTHHTAGISPTPATTGVPDVNTVEFLDTAVVLSNGLPDINVEDWLGTIVTAATAGRPDVNTAALDDNTNAAAVLSDKLQDGVIGTADSGSTTTIVDAARSEADDRWNGSMIVITSGASAGQARIITEFVASTDTITFAPAVTTNLGTETYVIIPQAGVDVQSWLGTEGAMSAPNALVSGAVEADVVSWLGTAAAAPTVAGVPEVDVTHMAGGVQTVTDLKDFADAGYDPGTNKVQGVVLVDTTTTNTDVRGTDSAALASVVGALNDAASADEVTSSDTLVQYVKQLINILAGAPGVVTLKAAAAPASGVSLSEMIRAIYDDTNSLDGTKVPQTLNLTASGNIGIDWANVENPTTALDLSATDIQLVDTATAVTNEVTADITKIGGSSTAADKLEEGGEALAIGTVNDASATTTDFIITLTGDTVDSTDDHYNGRIITFTTGILLQQSTDILDYTGSTKSVNVTALTEAPGNGDQFVIS